MFESKTSSRSTIKTPHMSNLGPSDLRLISKASHITVTRLESKEYLDIPMEKKKTPTEISLAMKKIPTEFDSNQAPWNDLVSSISNEDTQSMSYMIYYFLKVVSGLGLIAVCVMFSA